MNKTAIFIGIGTLALAGVAYFLLSKPSQSSGANFEKRATEPDYGDYGYDDIPTSDIPMPKSKKEVRRNCRKEAQEKCGRGLGKGKPKCRKNYRRDCKAAGGYDDGVADFAFNGFDGAFEFA